MKKIMMGVAASLSTFALTANVNAEDIIYGEDIPKGQEDDYAFLENETTIDAYKDLTEEEANSIKLELEKSGYTTVTLKKYSKKTGEDKKTIEEKFDSYDQAMEYLKELEANDIKVEKFEFVNDTDVVEDEIDKVYDTYADAINALDVFANDYTVVDPDGKKIFEIETDKIVDTITSTESYSNEDDAQKALDDFIKGNRTHDEYYTGEVVDESYPETGSINEHFDNADEANIYVVTLTNNGYEVKNVVFTNDQEPGSIDNQVFNSPDEAKAALDEFAKTYKVISSNIDNLTKNENSNKNYDDKIETKVFSSLEDAYKYLRESGYDAEKDEILDSEIVSVDYSIDPKNDEIFYGTYNKKFLTRKEADDKLAEFKNTYIVKNDSIVEKIGGGITGYEVVDMSEITGSNNYTVTLDYTGFAIARHNNNSVVFWTEKELTKAEQENFINALKKAPDISDELLQDSTFVFGTGKFLHNKLEVKRNDKNENLLDVMPAAAVSEFVYGTIQIGSRFELTARLYTPTTNYTVNMTKTMKGYDYILNATGTKTLESGTLTADTSIIIPKFTYKADKKLIKSHLIVSGSKNVTLDSGVLTADLSKDILEDFYAADVTRQKFEFVGGQGGDDAIVNPKTGENYWMFTFGGISLIGMAASSLYLKRKNDEN